MMKVINEDNGYESGNVWIPQWYEKEHLEELLVNQLQMKIGKDS